MENWKKILFDEETVKKLAKIFGCTVHTVRNALNGKYPSDLARKIRYRAIQHISACNTTKKQRKSWIRKYQRTA